MFIKRSKQHSILTFLQLLKISACCCLLTLNQKPFIELYTSETFKYINNLIFTSLILLIIYLQVSRFVVDSEVYKTIFEVASLLQLNILANLANININPNSYTGMFFRLKEVQTVVKLLDLECRKILNLTKKYNISVKQLVEILITIQAFIIIYFLISKFDSSTILSSFLSVQIINFLNERDCKLVFQNLIEELGLAKIDNLLSFIINNLFELMNLIFNFNIVDNIMSKVLNYPVSTIAISLVAASCVVKFVKLSVGCTGENLVCINLIHLLIMPFKYNFETDLQTTVKQNLNLILYKSTLNDFSIKDLLVYIIPLAILVKVCLINHHSWEINPAVLYVIESLLMNQPNKELLFIILYFNFELYVDFLIFEKILTRQSGKYFITRKKTGNFITVTKVIFLTTQLLNTYISNLSIDQILVTWLLNFVYKIMLVV